jgi:glycosyltransferase involved in cell wall biosynthesis
MRVSVALCTYNGGRHLAEQLASIAAQSRRPDELVICDDRSSDSTVEILTNFAQSAPFPVRLYRNEENLGSTRNFEKAIGLCQGELVALCDQDDVWYAHKLQSLAGVLESHPMLGGAFSDADLIREDSRLLGSRLWGRVHFAPAENAAMTADIAKILLKHDLVTGATLMFRADKRELILPVCPPWIHDGWIAWMLALYSSVASLRVPLMQYRVHDSQQVGIGPRSLLGRIQRAQQVGRAEYRLMARKFEIVRDRWCERPGENFRSRLQDLEGKIRHSYLRAELPRNRFMRLYRILGALHEYRKYGRGPISAGKDLILDLN